MDQQIIFNEAKNKPPPQQKISDSKKMDMLVEKAQNPLLRIKTAIPFNPFPDEVVVDINKVDIIYREFFGSQQVHSILIENISDVLVETSPFFATLKLIHTYYEEPIEVSYLKNHEASKAKKIIEGLVVAHKNNIALENLESEDLIEKMETIGAAD